MSSGGTKLNRFLITLANYGTVLVIEGIAEVRFVALDQEMHDLTAFNPNVPHPVRLAWRDGPTPVTQQGGFA